MYEDLLTLLSRRPEPYEPGEPKFWNDEHISKGMLATHLDPEDDLATRKIEFVERSADWIAGLADAKRPRLLDLGCGPGIYAEMFAQRGFEVKGIDFSWRSLAYARESALGKGLDIEYVCGNYLDTDFGGPFDIVTLIYFDFGVLSGEDRAKLLLKIRGALAPGGLLIFDVLTPAHYIGKAENKNWSFHEGGFWSEKPHACLHSFYRYDNCRTYCERYVIVEADRLRRFNIWNHAFTEEELRQDLKSAGFGDVRFYKDVSGSAYNEASSQAICAAAAIGGAV